MDNYEGGLKTSFSDGRGRLNLIVYNMEWDKYQLEQVDPSSTPCDANGAAANVSGLEAKAGVKTDKVCGQPWQNLVANTGKAHIAGANFEVDYRFTERLSGGLNFETMEAMSDDAVGIPDGQLLPLVPKNKGALWLDYNWPTRLFGSDNGFARFQYSTQDAIWNSITGGNLNSAANPRLRVPGYSIADVRFGFQAEDWEVSLFINNLTDERAQYNIANGDFGNAQAQSVDGVAHRQYVYTNRPREMGIRYTKSWN
jgi:outer membrane receptor protein involved in Fe transport